MKTTILTFLSLLSISLAMGQADFTNIDIKVRKIANRQGTEIICTGPSLTITFQLKQQSVQLNGNFVVVDSQVIQITPLLVTGVGKTLSTLDSSGQKQFLAEYSRYEMEYMTSELKIEIIHPSNQWVPVGSRKWFIWYFRVGQVPQTEAVKQFRFQLFASTLVGDKVITINAPIFADGDFTKAGLIVNQMMESMKVASAEKL